MYWYRLYMFQWSMNENICIYTHSFIYLYSYNFVIHLHKIAIIPTERKCKAWIP